MKYAVIVTYTTSERTGATVTASGCAAAWDKVFEMFDKADVRGVELAVVIMCPHDGDEDSCKGSPDAQTCIKCCLEWLREPAEVL